VFAPLGSIPDPEYLKAWVKKYKPGAVMFRPLLLKQIQTVPKTLQDNSEIPLLFAANLEEGGNGLVEEGTYFGKQLAVGGNWAFAPIVDVDMNWRNPITNLRTYGSDPEREFYEWLVPIKKDLSSGYFRDLKNFYPRCMKIIKASKGICEIDFTLY